MIVLMIFVYYILKRTGKIVKLSDIFDKHSCRIVIAEAHRCIDNISGTLCNPKDRTGIRGAIVKKVRSTRDMSHPPHGSPHDIFIVIYTFFFIKNIKIVHVIAVHGDIFNDTAVIWWIDFERRPLFVWIFYWDFQYSLFFLGVATYMNTQTRTLVEQCM